MFRCPRTLCRRTLAVLCATLIPALLHAESAILECTADTTIDSRTARQNYGRANELTLAGKSRFILLNFRFSAVPGWKVRKASLLIHLQDISDLRTIGVAVVPVNWKEEETSYAEAENGRAWTGKKASVKDLLLKAPNAQTAMAPVSDRDLGWMEISIPPEFINSIISGNGFGLALYDKNLRVERSFDSRESVRFAPYLRVEGSSAGNQ